MESDMTHIYKCDHHQRLSFHFPCRSYDCVWSVRGLGNYFIAFLIGVFVTHMGLM